MSSVGSEQRQCPVCNFGETRIIEHHGNRRRRRCGRCMHRWTTYEVSAERLEQLEAIEQHAAAIAEVVNAGSK